MAVCRRLGAMGASIALTATSERVHDRVNELEEAGVSAMGVVAGLADPAAPGELIAAVQDRWDRLDILVNNAGVISVTEDVGSSAGLPPLSYTEWQRSVRRNVDTAFLMSRAALPMMRRGAWGRIVMVASVTGPVTAMRDDEAYAAAKAGMAGLAKSLAAHLAGERITANAVALGWIASGSQTQDEGHEGDVTPLGRSGSVDEVAWPVVWLCAPAAAYVTGQCLVVDGGKRVAEARRV